MAVSASQLQNLLKEAFPSDPAQMRVTDIMVPSGRINYVDEIIGYGESGPMYGSRPEPEMVVGGYYSPALGRQLTAAETQHLIPIKANVEGQGQITTGLVYPGEKAIKLFNELGYTGSQMSGQATPNGFEVYPIPGTIATDQGDRTNIALSYGSSGGPEARAYQSSTLTGSVNLDKIVDQLAKAANAALLTYVSGQALGAIGGDLLGAAAGDPTKAALYSNAGYGEGLLNMTPPTIISEPVLVPGDTALTGTLAQPPLAVENIAGQLTPEAQALMLSSTLPVTPLVVETPAGVLSPDTANIINTTAVEGSMTPVTTGDPTKAALYSNEGYGPLSDQTVTGAPITSSPITSLGPAATLKDITDYLTGGAFAGTVTDALKEAFKAATGGGQQQGGGLGGLGPIIGGLLSRSPTAAPTASVTPGRPVDITSPIQSLLAPKLVQQRPVTLL